LVTKFPKIKTRSLVFDFGKFHKISDYQEKIGAVLKDIDIAMLFLNAGYIRCGSFTDISAEEIEQSCMINALQPIYTAKSLIEQIVARGQLGAIVITSSGLGSAAIPGCIDYSCTKSFASMLGEGLNFELKGKVDCMSWQSGKVSTKMNGDPVEGHCVAVETAVSGMLKDLGREELTYGCAPHAKGMFMINLFPMSVLKAKFYEGFKKDRQKQLDIIKKQS